MFIFEFAKNDDSDTKLYVKKKISKYISVLTCFLFYICDPILLILSILLLLYKYTFYGFMEANTFFFFFLTQRCSKIHHYSCIHHSAIYIIQLYTIHACILIHVCQPTVDQLMLIKNSYLKTSFERIRGFLLLNIGTRISRKRS